MYRLLFLLFLASLTLSGCGQKGPLYLPDEGEELSQLRAETIAP